MILIDGKLVSKTEENKLKDIISKMSSKPKFVAIQVGHNSASMVYLKAKKRMSEKLNIDYELIHLLDTTNEKLSQLVQKINNDTSIHGCIIQLPLPSHIDRNIINLIDPKKDVDGFTKYNLGCVLSGDINLCAATPLGIIKLIDYYKIPTQGKHCVIIGKSNIVGKPLSFLMANEETYKATVSICDKYTLNLKELVKTADILMVCAGVHHLIDDSFTLKPDVAIIDVGIHRIAGDNGYHLEGDVDFDYFKDKCSYITPVPGGVGPMTVLSLISNVVDAYLIQNVSTIKNINEKNDYNITPNTLII